MADNFTLSHFYCLKEIKTDSFYFQNVTCSLCIPNCYSYNTWKSYDEARTQNDEQKESDKIALDLHSELNFLVLRVFNEKEIRLYNESFKDFSVFFAATAKTNLDFFRIWNLFFLDTIKERQRHDDVCARSRPEMSNQST